MVLISHIYNFIYIKNRKVAGTSIESFFGQFCVNPKTKYDFEHKSNQTINKFGIIGGRAAGKRTRWNGHIAANKIKKYLGQKKFNKYLKFCVIRNPYDKMVSKYFWVNKNSKKLSSFKDFVKYYNVNNLDLHSINNNSVCDYYIRYENLEEDIIKLCKMLNIKNYNINDIPKFKSQFRTNRKHYSKYYDNETRKIVYKKCKKEFDLFGYKFEKK
jgi:hypothetical protein